MGESIGLHMIEAALFKIFGNMEPQPVYCICRYEKLQKFILYVLKLWHKLMQVLAPSMQSNLGTAIITIATASAGGGQQQLSMGPVM